MLLLLTGTLVRGTASSCTVQYYCRSGQYRRGVENHFRSLYESLEYHSRRLSLLLIHHRLLGEHGLIGLIIIFLLIAVPSFKMIGQPFSNRAFISAFMIFWFLTINHSSMRIAAPAFIYGLCLLNIQYEKPIIHRKQLKVN